MADSVQSEPPIDLSHENVENGMDSVEVKEEPDNDYSAMMQGHGTAVPDDGDMYDEDLKPKTEMEEDLSMLSCQYCGHMTGTTEEMNDHMSIHLEDPSSENVDSKEGLVAVDELLKGKGIKEESYVADLVMEKRDVNTLVMTEKNPGRVSRVEPSNQLGIVFYTNLPPGGINKESGSKTGMGSYYFCLACGYVSGDREEVKDHCDDLHGDSKIPCFICCEKLQGGSFISSVHEFFGKYSAMKVKDQKSVSIYVCQMCGMRHFYSAYVRRHILSAHGQHLRKPYRCIPCKFACFEYPHLIHHIKTKHPNHDYGTKVDQTHMKIMKDFLLKNFKIVFVKYQEIDQVCENICVFAAIESLTCPCNEPDENDDNQTSTEKQGASATISTAAKSTASEEEDEDDDEDDDGGEEDKEDEDSEEDSDPDWRSVPAKRHKGAVRGRPPRSRGTAHGRGVVYGQSSSVASRRFVATSATTATRGHGRAIAGRGRAAASAAVGAPGQNIMRSPRGSPSNYTLGKIAEASKVEELQFFYCSACGFISTIRNNVSAHIMTHHGNARLTCVLCDCVFKQAQQGIIGDECHEYTDTLGTLDVSVYKMSGKIPVYTCPHSNCEFRHVIRSCTKKHINSVHGNQNHLPFVCKYCAFSSADLKLLKHHHAVNHKESEIDKEKKVSAILQDPEIKFLTVNEVESLVRTRRLRAWNFHLVRPADIDIKVEPE